ncbi:hypothetical protein M404DRAFT_1006735 [Pisolithus tinctorius Marx 270]|uniref:Uncharacterized protein n=1 Tax=Pisolithus tinctorius Marx 270 TaxID=870435 RepID=A0A0C3NLG9_PISTI|nr:hypothetical protein M404DRAFT_1006735 [Pisolithus tinctorius Marx 270]
MAAQGERSSVAPKYTRQPETRGQYVKAQLHQIQGRDLNPNQTQTQNPTHLPM